MVNSENSRPRHRQVFEVKRSEDQGNKLPLRKQLVKKIKALGISQTGLPFGLDVSVTLEDVG